MTLAILVYLAGVMSSIPPFFVLLSLLLAVLSLGCFLASEGSNKTGLVTKAVCCLVGAVFSLFTMFLIPNERTMYVMAGAYAAQAVAENPNVQRISGKVITIIDKKLDEIVDEGVKKAGAIVKEKAEAAVK